MTAWMWPPPVEIPERHRRKAMDDAASSYGRVLKPGQLDTSHGVVLYLDNICVSFDGFKALNNLSLSIDVGELRCVIGPNGAGKTTMMDVITGKTRADSGTAFFGQTIDLKQYSEVEIAQAGIGRKFQKPTIFEQHTVFENLELSMKADKRVRKTLFARLSSAERDRIAGGACTEVRALNRESRPWWAIER